MRRNIQRWRRNIGGNIGGRGASPNTHHVFVQCPHFDLFHASATSSIISSTTTTLDASTLSSANRQTILEQARGLFYDSDIWPAQRSLYYLGILPTLLKVNPTSPNKTKTTHIWLANDWHTLSIRLAVRIWGDAHRKFQAKHTPLPKPRNSLSLPSHFQTIIPSTYPSFDISFHWLLFILLFFYSFLPLFSYVLVFLIHPSWRGIA